MSIKDRFKMVMDREKLTAGAFAESIGVAQATISHILGPRNKYPSTEVILRLHQRYNDINLESIAFPAVRTEPLITSSGSKYCRVIPQTRSNPKKEPKDDAIEIYAGAQRGAAIGGEVPAYGIAARGRYTAFGMAPVLSAR